jgi:anti-sigma factor RsiW
MKRCSDLEPLFTPYVDGQAAPSDVADVAAHLEACPPCRVHVQQQRVARALVVERRSAMCEAASSDLHTRCAAACAGRSRRLVRWVPLSAAAALVLAVAGIFLYGSFDRGARALATQLALDHVKCFAVFKPDGRTDPKLLSAGWQKTQGWELPVPPPNGTLELLGVRRCISSEGRTAHIMYRHDGKPLSLFVARDEGRQARTVEAIGHEAILWSEGDRLFVLIGQQPREELERVAAYVKTTAARRPE